MPQSYFVLTYLLILGFHFLYADRMIRKKLIPMDMGGIRSRWLILFLLVVVNGFSISVFFFPNQHGPNPLWAQLNVVYHLILAGDELIRTRKYILRLPFLVNHLFWSALIHLFLVG